MVMDPARQPQSSVGWFDRLAGRVRWGHWCKTPSAFVRWIRQVRAGDTWTCGCGQRWRWGIDPLAKTYGFSHREWVRCP